MRESSVPANDEPYADAGTGLLAIGSFLAGIVIGASGPLFIVSVTVTLVAGPSWGGLALLGALVLGAVATAIVLAGLAVGHRSYFGVTTAVACATLVAGIFLGAWYGSSVRTGDWAAARPTPTPRTAMPSFPTVLEAHADLILALDRVPGFTAMPTTDGPEGTFGHWCYSGPDSEAVGSVSAMDVARVGSWTIWAESRLVDSTPALSSSSFSYPFVTLQLRQPSGFTPLVWSGPARVVKMQGASGTVAFDALVADADPPEGLPRTISGELSWTCQAWAR